MNEETGLLKLIKKHLESGMLFIDRNKFYESKSKITFNEYIKSLKNDLKKAGYFSEYFINQDKKNEHYLNFWRIN